MTYRSVYEQLIFINDFIRFRFTINHNVRCYHIIVSHTCSKAYVIFRQLIQVIQMLVLCKTARLDRISISKFRNVPFTRT